MPARSAAALSVPLALLLPLCACVTNVQQNAAMQQSAPAAVAMMHTAAVTRPPPGSVAAKADVGKLPEVDRTYRGEVTFLDRRTPLPDGEWTVIATSKTTYRNGPLAGGVILLRHRGNVVTGLIHMVGNKDPRESGGFPVSRVCTTSDVIWSDARAAEPGGAQDCVAITFNRTAQWRDPGASAVYRAITRALDSHDVTPPPVLIGTAFAVTNARYHLFEYVWLNPDLAGIAPDLAAYRSQSDWASFNLSRDPRKQAYIERLKAWSAGWREVLTKVIDGERWSLPPDVAATP